MQLMVELIGVEFKLSEVQNLYSNNSNVNESPYISHHMHASVVYGFHSFSCVFSPKVARRFWCGWGSRPSHPFCHAPVCMWEEGIGARMYYIMHTSWCIVDTRKI